MQDVCSVSQLVNLEDIIVRKSAEWPCRVLLPVSALLYMLLKAVLKELYQNFVILNEGNLTKAGGTVVHVTVVSRGWHLWQLIASPHKYRFLYFHVNGIEAS